MNQFPSDFPHTLTGFGGDPGPESATASGAQQEMSGDPCARQRIEFRTSQVRMEAMKTFLKDAAYQDGEIWAVDDAAR